MYFNKKSKRKSSTSRAAFGGLSEYVTVLDQPSPPGGHQRSLLAPKMRRITKASLAKQQKDIKHREQEKLKDLLSQKEMHELELIQQQTAESQSLGWEINNNPSSEWEDVPLTFDAGAEDTEDEQIDVTEGFGLSRSSLEWANRLSAEHTAWNEQLVRLCDTYMAYHAGTPGASDSTDAIEGAKITLQCISMKGECTRTFVSLTSDVGPNIVLLRNGYLAPTPSRPTVAFSLELLEVVHAIQRRSPSTSTEALAKAFCDLRNVPYVPHHRSQLSSTLDAYLLILRSVQNRLNSALGRNSVDWQLKHCCPACMYKLVDEPNIHADIHVTCDGNDSLKRCATVGSADGRSFKSDFFIPVEEVNRFKDEVVNSRQVSSRPVSTKDESKTECERRWKNASADETAKLRPKRYYEETGVFVSMCRHSFVLTICDMVKSGELAKYGLATINKLVSAFGPRIVVGYDIGCSFLKTVSRSALLGPRVNNLGFAMCCGAFHGPAHNRACQVNFHPHHQLGMGLTDFENCETLFSSSNRVAGATRLASRFHRHQKIDLFMECYNEDSYAGLGKLLRSKYIAALKIIDSATRFIEDTGLSEDELKLFFQQEKEYLASYKSSPPVISFAIHYVELLEQLETKSAEFQQVINTTNCGTHSTSADLRRVLFTSQIDLKLRSVTQQLATIEQAVDKMETEHNIRSRWTRSSPEWIDAQEVRANREFYQCLDNLEQLLVRRVLEWSRVGIAGTGYKLRMQIMKALATRGKAIKAALQRYNKAAASLSPPAPIITWAQIVDVSVLSELHILRGSRRELLSQPWTTPRNRQAVNQYHRLLRAREEVNWLNVEIRRLLTSITDEELSLREQCKHISDVDLILGWFADRYVTRRLAVNTLIRRELRFIMQTPMYSGWSSTGTRIQEEELPGSRVASVELACKSLQIDQPDDRQNDLHSAASPDLTSQTQLALSSQEESAEDLEVDDRIIEQFAQWQGMLDGDEEDTDEEDVNS